MNLIKRLVSQPAAGAEASATPPKTDQDTPALSYEDLQRMVVLYSNLLAGNGTLHAMCRDTLGFHAPVEPFNAGLAAGNPANFHTFLAQKEGRAQSAHQNGAGSFYEFLGAFFAEQPPEGRVLFDLRYAQAHSLGMDAIRMVPEMLRVLVEQNVPIIHLMRRDLVEQAALILCARVSGDYSDTGSDTREPIWLDPEEVLLIARAARNAARQAIAAFETLDATPVTIFYEDLLTEQAPDRINRLCTQIDHYVELPDDVRVDADPRPTARLVANRDEIEHFVLKADPGLSMGLTS